MACPLPQDGETQARGPRDGTRSVLRPRWLGSPAHSRFSTEPDVPELPPQAEPVALLSGGPPPLCCSQVQAPGGAPLSTKVE